MIPLI